MSNLFFSNPLVLADMLASGAREPRELPTIALSALEREWETGGADGMRLFLVLAAFRWLELPCSLKVLTDSLGFFVKTIEGLTKVRREAVFDDRFSAVTLDRHPRVAALFLRAASRFRFFPGEILKPMCEQFGVTPEGLQTLHFGSTVVAAVVAAGVIDVSSVVDRLMFNLFYDETVDFAQAAVVFERSATKREALAEGMHPSMAERRLVTAFAAYDAMRRQPTYTEGQAWNRLEELRNQLGVPSFPEGDFDRKGYLLYQIGYHHRLINEPDLATQYFAAAAEADDAWGRSRGSERHLGKAAMNRIAAIHSECDVQNTKAERGRDPVPDLPILRRCADQLESERKRLEQLLDKTHGIDWYWVQRWHQNALLHLAEVEGCLGNETGVQILISEAKRRVQSVLPALAPSTDEAALLAQAALKYAQGDFDAVISLFKDIREKLKNAGEGIGRVVQLLALAHRQRGNTADFRRWCEWLQTKCPVDKANGFSVDWAMHNCPAQEPLER